MFSKCKTFAKCYILKNSILFFIVENVFFSKKKNVKPTIVNVLNNYMVDFN